jgi:GH15 family glucan-1,4-alpha-glucosidase
MCWVAFDRAIRIAQEQGLPAPLDDWRATRDILYKEIMENTPWIKRWMGPPPTGYNF